MSAPSLKTCRAVDERADECCEVCGVYARGGSRHHRRPKGMGGDKRPGTNTPSNLILVCGSGTTGCHARIHSDRSWSEPLGLLLPKETVDPSSIPVTLRVGRVLLDDVGGYQFTE